MGLWFPRPPRRPPRPLRQKVAGGVGVQVDYEHCTRPPRSPVPGARRRRSVCRSSISLAPLPLPFPPYLSPIDGERPSAHRSWCKQAAGSCRFYNTVVAGAVWTAGTGCIGCLWEHGQRGEREDGCLATLISSWKFPLSSSSRVEHGAKVRERARYRKERKRTERPPALRLLVSASSPSSFGGRLCAAPSLSLFRLTRSTGRRTGAGGQADSLALQQPCQAVARLDGDDLETQLLRSLRDEWERGGEEWGLRVERGVK